jgi:hypothetical protein
MEIVDVTVTMITGETALRAPCTHRDGQDDLDITSVAGRGGTASQNVATTRVAREDGLTPLAGCRSQRGGVTGRYGEPVVRGVRTILRASASESDCVSANVPCSRAPATASFGCTDASVSGVRVTDGESVD